MSGSSVRSLCANLYANLSLIRHKKGRFSPFWSRHSYRLQKSTLIPVETKEERRETDRDLNAALHKELAERFS